MPVPASSPARSSPSRSAPRSAGAGISRPGNRRWPGSAGRRRAGPPSLRGAGWGQTTSSWPRRSAAGPAADGRCGRRALSARHRRQAAHLHLWPPQPFAALHGGPAGHGFRAADRRRARRAAGHPGVSAVPSRHAWARNTSGSRKSRSTSPRTGRSSSWARCATPASTPTSAA